MTEKSILLAIPVSPFFCDDNKDQIALNQKVTKYICCNLHWKYKKGKAGWVMGQTECVNVTGWIGLG